MPRDILIGNGSLLVNFDQPYQLRDLYWPHVGRENHTAGHPSRFGVWVDGQFRLLVLLPPDKSGRGTSPRRRP
jgi:glucoamylase